MMLRQRLAIAAATPNVVPMPARTLTSTDQPVKVQRARGFYLSKTDARTPQIRIDRVGETERLPARDFAGGRGRQPMQTPCIRKAVSTHRPLNDMTSFPRDEQQLVHTRIHAGETAGRWAKQPRNVFLPVRGIMSARNAPMTEPRNRVVQVKHFGGPEGLEVVDAPLPTADRGEVRVRVLASGLEYTDVVIRRHLYPQTMRRRPPFVLGYDLVGDIDQLGDGVRGFSGWRPRGRYDGARVECRLSHAPGRAT